MKSTRWFQQILRLTLTMILFVCSACLQKGGKLTPERFFTGQMLQLARAIVEEDTTKIKTLITSGVNPNHFGREGITPLLFAYGVGKKKAMSALLENGADPNLRITSPEAPPTLLGQSAVTFIAGTPDNEYLKLLLDHGGDKNAKSSSGEPILIKMAFMAPKNYPGIEMLLQRGADINATDSGGDTLLSNLALTCDFEHVYYLLERGADFRIKNDNGYDISGQIFNYKIDKIEFPADYEWQRKCQLFLLAHGMKEPGPPKPIKLTPHEEAERLRMYQEAQEADRRRHGY